MPLLVAADAANLPAPDAEVHPTWCYLERALRSRNGDLRLESDVRDGGDSWFHSLLLSLHFKGVRFLDAALEGGDLAMSTTSAVGDEGAIAQVQDPPGRFTLPEVAW